jgi:predicted metal-dependent hydrolase
MGQEATHGRAHQAALEEHLLRHGVDVAPITRAVQRLANQIVVANPLGVVLPRALRLPWLLLRLAMVAAFEQIFTVLGQWILENEALEQAGAHPKMLDLIRWHGAEEVEHRSVAFDAHRAFGGGYLGRVLAMAIVAPVTTGFFIAATRHLVREARRLSGTGRRDASFRDFVAKSRRGLLPTGWHLAGALLRFCMPGHHPAREGDDELSAQYLHRAPGVQTTAP